MMIVLYYCSLGDANLFKANMADNIDRSFCPFGKYHHVSEIDHP